MFHTLYYDSWCNFLSQVAVDLVENYVKNIEDSLNIKDLSKDHTQFNCMPLWMPALYLRDFAVVLIHVYL